MTNNKLSTTYAELSTEVLFSLTIFADMVLFLKLVLFSLSIFSTISSLNKSDRYRPVI